MIREKLQAQHKEVEKAADLDRQLAAEWEAKQVRDARADAEWEVMCEDDDGSAVSAGRSGTRSRQNWKFLTAEQREHQVEVSARNELRQELEAGFVKTAGGG